jgi:prepilin-type N-terminal cleavage/methylation domain-containing protein
MSNPRADRRAGFTLVETLVAAVVAGLATASLAGAVGVAARLQTRADGAAKAMLIAETVLARGASGVTEIDGYTVNIARTDLSEPGVTVGGLVLVEIAVSVTGPDGAKRTLRTRTLEARR